FHLYFVILIVIVSRRHSSTISLHCLQLLRTVLDVFWLQAPLKGKLAALSQIGDFLQGTLQVRLWLIQFLFQSLDRPVRILSEASKQRIDKFVLRHTGGLLVLWLPLIRRRLDPVVESSSDATAQRARSERIHSLCAFESLGLILGFEESVGSLSHKVAIVGALYWDNVAFVPNGAH